MRFTEILMYRIVFEMINNLALVFNIKTYTFGMFTISDQEFFIDTYIT